MTTAKPPPDLSALRGGDLLLILIVVLAALSLITLLVTPLVDRPAPVEGRDTGLLVGLPLLLLTVQSAVLVGTVYLVAVRRRGLPWAALGLRPARRRWYRRAIVIALLLLPLAGIINLIVQQFLSEATVNPQFQVIAPAGFSWSALLGMLLVVGLFIPFAEELLFRGLLYGWLRRRLGVPAAALLSALLFSGLHRIVWLIPALAVIGVILALVYEKSGSLWPAVIVHALFNSVGVVLVYLALAQDLPLV
jgi:membrane protease YdiL (CAAX protease family)